MPAGRPPSQDKGLFSPDLGGTELSRVIAADAELRDRLRATLLVALDQIEKIMRYGTPETKMRIAQQSIVPLLRNLTAGSGDGGMEALRAELAEYHRAVLEYETPSEDDDETATVDTARETPRGPVIVGKLPKGNVIPASLVTVPTHE